MGPAEAQELLCFGFFAACPRLLPDILKRDSGGISLQTACLAAAASLSARVQGKMTEVFVILNKYKYIES